MEPIVIIDNDRLTTQPGVPVITGIRVKNTGVRNTAYDLSVVGLPKEWVTITPPQVRPREREADAASAVVTITPPMGPASLSGPVPFGVKATATVDGSSSVDEGIVTIGGQGGLDLVPVATQRTARWRARFPIELHNTGTEELRMALVAHDPADETVLSFDREIVTLAPQAMTTVTLKAKVRSPTLRGSPGVRQLNVALHTHERGDDMPRPGQPVAPGSDPLHRTAMLTLTQKAILSKGVTAVAGLIVLLLVALIAYRLFLYSEPEPGTAAPARGPAVTFEEVPGGVVLQWIPVSGADRYRITASPPPDPQIPFEDVSGATTLFHFPVLRPDTQYTIRVTPFTGDQQGTSTEFTATPLTVSLDPPTGVSVQESGNGPGEYLISWTYPQEGAHFNIRVDGKLDTGDVADLQTTIVLQPGKRSLTVDAFIPGEDGRASGPSQPPVEVDVPVPAEPAADEGGAGSDAVITGEEEGTGDGTVDGAGVEGGVTGDGSTGGSGEPGPTTDPFAANPFVVVLQTTQAVSGGGVEGQSPKSLRDSYQVIVDAADGMGDVSVLAIPAAAYTFALPGGAVAPNEGTGFVIGIAYPTEDDAAAACANPSLVELVQGVQGDDRFANPCIVLAVAPKA